MMKLMKNNKFLPSYCSCSLLVIRRVINGMQKRGL